MKKVSLNNLAKNVGTEQEGNKKYGLASHLFINLGEGKGESVGKSLYVTQKML